MEKTVNLHRYKEVYKPRNINVYLIMWIIRRWQCILPEVTVKDCRKCCLSIATDGTDGMLCNDTKRMEMLGVSVTKTNALTVTMETVTLIGRGRQNLIYEG